MEVGYGVVYVRVDRRQHGIFIQGAVVVVGMREDHTFIAIDNIFDLVADVWIIGA